MNSHWLYVPLCIALGGVAGWYIKAYWHVALADVKAEMALVHEKLDKLVSAIK